MHLRPVEPGVWQILRVMGPVVLGLGFPQLSSLFEGLVIQWFSRSPGHETWNFLGRSIGLPLGEGTQVCVYSASQLYQFPMGVLAISLSVAIFPLLSRYAARGDMAAMREGVNRALRVSAMEGIAAGTGLFVLAEPITSLIYQRRKFTADAVHETAAVLQMFVIGMLAYSTYQIFLKAFYAMKEPIKPLKVVAVMAVVNMVLVFSLIWVPGLRSRAFGIATAVTMSLDAIVLAVMLKMQLGRIGGRKLLKSLLRSGVAAAAMAAAIYALRIPLAGRPNWLIVAVCVPAGAAVFLATAKLLRMPELRELLGKE
jgi:putative peptidoglycan lipid II flippase